jgi:hypothetical protein
MGMQGFGNLHHCVCAVQVSVATTGRHFLVLYVPNAIILSSCFDEKQSMKNLFSRNWIQNLSEQQKDVLLGLVIILIVAVIYYFQWAFYLTGLEGSKVNIDQPARYFWWANDSQLSRCGNGCSDAVTLHPSITVPGCIRSYSV